MTGVTIGCFLLSYLTLWAFELSRLWFRLPWRAALLIVCTTVAVLTHALFLFDRARLTYIEQGHWSIPATFFDWSQIAAFGLALAYLILIIRRPNSIFGIFLLPIVISIILAAMLMRSGRPFERGDNFNSLWGYIHGGGLSAAVVSVSLGFVVAIMRIWQQYRLKMKRGIGGPIRLPSLEYLDSTGRSCLIASTACIATGLIGGVIMNAATLRSVSWVEPGIVVSCGLLVWMLVALVIESNASKRGGSKAVLLNMVSFFATVIAISVVLLNSHGRDSDNQSAVSPVEPAAVVTEGRPL